MEEINIGFVEEDYLELYPDVKEAVQKGVLLSGHDHYLKYGRGEGRKGMKYFDVSTLKNFPSIFLSRIEIKYPPDMKQPFEEWFYDNYSEKDKTERVYLPIFWTGYQVNADFGKDTNKIQLLQDFVNNLDKSKKYYTILNYDDGCLVDFKDLDILIFTASGKGGNGAKCTNYPIPLISNPHSCIIKQKDIYCSFVGRYATHPIRQRIYDLFKDRKDMLFAENKSIDEFCEITARSRFVLAPRGYGLTSFRIFEALQYDAIPVYISDYHVSPFGIDNFYVKVYDYEVSKLPEILSKVDQDFRLKNGMEFYKKYCLYEPLKNQILTILRNEK